MILNLRELSSETRNVQDQSHSSLSTQMPQERRASEWQSYLSSVVYDLNSELPTIPDLLLQRASSVARDTVPLENDDYLEDDSHGWTQE